MVTMKQFLQTYPIFFLIFVANIMFLLWHFKLSWYFESTVIFIAMKLLFKLMLGNFSVYWSCFQYIAKIWNNVLASGSFPCVKCWSISFHTNNWGSHLLYSVDERNLNWVCINVYQKKKGSHMESQVGIMWSFFYFSLLYMEPTFVGPNGLKLTNLLIGTPHVRFQEFWHACSTYVFRLSKKKILWIRAWGMA